MGVWRRVGVIVSMVFAAGCAVPAWAQSFPSRPIQLIVTGNAGASSDIIARKLGKIIQDQTGATVVIDNKAGGSGSIGLLQTIRAPADGHTLVIAVPDSVVIFPQLKKVRPYSLDKDLTPIAQVAETHFVFAVNARNPAGNLAEFAAQAKARPADAPLRYASPGNATTARLVTEMFMTRAGINLTHIPYRATVPGLVGLVGGETEIMATSIASAKSLVDGGQIKLIGITRDKRLPGFDKIPTAVESGFSDLVVPVWWCIFAPANLPADVRDKVVAVVARAAGTDEMKAQLATLGLDGKVRTGAELGAFLARDASAWHDIMRRVDLPLEE